jgi:Protein of unknown function (DUF3307)
MVGLAMVNVHILSLIFILFIVKHVLADFVLQTSWMWGTKDKEHGWLAPLAAHAGCHAAFTLVLALVINPALWWLGVVDFALHAIIDRARAVVGRRLGIVLGHSYWWWLFGTDQALHHLTHFAYAIALAPG